MEHDETFHPTDIGFFGAITQVLQTHDLTHLSEQCAFGLAEMHRNGLCHGSYSHVAMDSCRKIVNICSDSNYATAIRIVQSCVVLDGPMPENASEPDT